MSEPIWYFAVGDEERGPVTEAQIRTLIGTGNLGRDDLVWKEGMADWMSAGQVPGLFDKVAPPANAGAKSRGEPASRPQAAPAAPNVTTPKVAPRQRRDRPAIDFAKPLDALASTETAGRWLFVVGLLFVLLSKGCSTVADSYSARLGVRATVIEQQFQDAWDRERLTLQKREQQLAERSSRSSAEAAALSDLRKQISQLDDDKRSEMETLRSGKWRDLKIAARDADANRVMWGFWRQSVFFVGTIIFALGLLAVSLYGQGAEKWLGLAILAILVASIYLKIGVWSG